MKRRAFISTVVVGTGVLAGCLGGSGNDGGGTPTRASTPTADDSSTQWSGASGGDVAISVEYSADIIEYGDPYSVTISARNQGDDSAMMIGDIVYRTGDQSSWDYLTEMEPWSVAAGQTQSKTFDVQPTATGTLEVGYQDVYEGIIDTWTLEVNAPNLVYGEQLVYYDGLGVTVDISLADAVEAPIRNLMDEDYREDRLVRPNTGRTWGVIDVTLENTDDNDDVDTPLDDGYTLLLAGNQQSRLAGGRQVDWMELETLYEGELTVLDTYFPPEVLVPGASSSGRIVFDVSEDVDLTDATVMLTRYDVRSRWE